MLDIETKKRIDAARDILVGKLPDPKSQVEQITIALIYKFMDDMDKDALELGGKAKFFKGDYQKYAWSKIFDPRMSGFELANVYGEAVGKMNQNPNIPQLFRDIFKNAYLPYRDPETLKSFLKVIGEFEYDHSERLGDAFEYLLSVLGSQGEAGQFRTPRHIIDFMVEIIDPKKNESILDPACGTAGFLISAYKFILKHNSKNFDPRNDLKAFELHDVNLEEITINNKKYGGDKLTPDDKERLANSIVGYDISPDMVRLSLVNMYLHDFNNPKIFEYDTLTSEDKWQDNADVIMANPPFMSPKGGIRPHKRFSIESNRSEVLFVDYIAEHLTPHGRSCVIVPDGVTFKLKTQEKSLRKMLIEKDYLVGVISLPAGVFNPYSGIKTFILWLDKTLAKKSDKILFVKIENDGFDLGAQRRPIKYNDLPDAFKAISAYKESLIGKVKFRVEDWGNTLLVAKSKIAQGGDYDLSDNCYRVTADHTNTKWPMVELGEMLDYEQPTNYIVESVNYDDKYAIPVLTAGKSFILGHTDEKKGIFRDRLPVIIFDDFTTAIKYVDFPFKVKSSAMKILHAKKDVADIRYVFYAMQKIDFVPSAHKRYWISQYSKIKIPLPPLPVQKDIVAQIGGHEKSIVKLEEEIVSNKAKIKKVIADLWSKKH